MPDLDGDRFEIEFKNVSFKYPGANQYALENVSIKIENGSHLAVVGRNGSGKTTFIKLMCRLYDVTDGEILINGENIQAYTKESIINLYSVVFQDFKIFSVPLRDTVCAGWILTGTSCIPAWKMPILRREWNACPIRKTRIFIRI